MQPYPTPQAEADAIIAFADGDMSKRLGTFDQLRLAAVRADAYKMAAELRLLTFSQRNSQTNKPKN